MECQGQFMLLDITYKPNIHAVCKIWHAALSNSLKSVVELLTCSTIGCHEMNSNASEMICANIIAYAYTFKPYRDYHIDMFPRLRQLVIEVGSISIGAPYGD